VRFVAEQLGEDGAQFPGYAARQQTAYEHAWEIRDTHGYCEFADGEGELREFLAARAWSSLEGPRALFDRAVVWLIGSRVLLPGITTLARAVAGIRQEGERAAVRRACTRRSRTGCGPAWPAPGSSRSRPHHAPTFQVEVGSRLPISISARGHTPRPRK
jgi:hypothetical protein